MPFSSYQLIMKCWEEKPEYRPTFTQQIEDLSTLLELQAGYLGCSAGDNGTAEEIDPMPTSMSSDDIAMTSNGTSDAVVATSNEDLLSPSSDVPSGEERDAVIDPLSNKEGAPTDDNMAAHTRGDDSVPPQDFVERKCESSGDECGDTQ